MNTEDNYNLYAYNLPPWLFIIVIGPLFLSSFLCTGERNTKKSDWKLKRLRYTHSSQLSRWKMAGWGHSTVKNWTLYSIFIFFPCWNPCVILSVCLCFCWYNHVIWNCNTRDPEEYQEKLMVVLLRKKKCFRKHKNTSHHQPRRRNTVAIIIILGRLGFKFSAKHLYKFLLCS